MKKGHILPALGEKRIDSLTTAQLQLFFNNARKKGRVQKYGDKEPEDLSLSPRMIHGIYLVLSNALEQAVEESILLKNPAKKCKLPKIERKEMKTLPEDKIGAYLACAEKRGVLAPFFLELTTGLRRGELLALLWSDLDIQAQTISVTKQVAREQGKLMVSRPKTANSIRTVAVPQQTIDILIAEHEKHPDSPYLFVSPKTGGMYDPDSFGHIHKKILKDAGLEDIRFHDLRHTFATLSLKHGVDVKTLSAALGHYSAGFTLNTYTHATTEMQHKAASTIGNVVSAAQ